MSAPASAAAPPSEPARRLLRLVGGLLVLGALVAYHNTLSLPFIFDDQLAIVENSTIRRLWPLTTVLVPPADGGGVLGRPLVNLSFALNHAISGDAVWSYHALNLLIHAGAGLVLFGLVRRTLQLPVLPARVRGAALPLGFTVAGLWLLHPLQTESVTSIVQRTESLVGLFYLLVLYGLVRALSSAQGRGWLVVSFLACLLGMATKEVMVTAPVLALAFDCTFGAGSLREAWRRRRGYHLALAGTWLLLGALLLQIGGSRGEAAGFGLGVSSWDYLLTQCQALVLYLKLTLWPHPLVLDYGTAVVGSWREVIPQGIGVLLLLGLTAWTWWRRPVLGFLGISFFVVLAPSSSLVPLVGQTIAEHRMYLPLAAVITLLVLAVHAVLPRAGWWLWGGLAIICCLLTVARNEVYRDELTIWTDVVQSYPSNARGHYNLANELVKTPGRETAAVEHYREALRLKSDYPEAHFNLANQLARLPGGTTEAIAHYEAALHQRPGYAEAHNNLAITLARLPGRLPEAIWHYQAALQFQPDYAEAHCNLGVALATQPGRLTEAMAHYEAALRLQPDYAEAHNNLAAALATFPERRAEAIRHYEAAVRLQPGYAEAHNNLALELARQPDRVPEAIGHYEAALRLRPGYAEAHCNLGAALTALPGRLPEAIRHFEAAVRADPGYLLARSNLALALANTGRLEEAASQLEAMLALDPGQMDAARRLRAIRAILERR